MGDATPSLSAVGTQLTLSAAPRHDSVGLPLAGPAPDHSRSCIWRSTQLEPGELRIDSTVLDLGDTLLSSAAINRTSLHRLRVPAACVSLLIGSRSEGALFVHSQQLTAAQGICVEPGREVELIAHRRSACVLISINEALLMREFGRASLTGTRFRSGVRAIDCSMGECEAFAELVRTVMQSGGSLYRTALLERVRRTAMELLCRAARCATTRMALSNITRPERGRRCAAVELARQYIREHLTEPLHLADLCSNTHMQPRSLEYGFREVVRLSPMRYVRMLRLGEVRRQLSQGSAVKRSISEIALDAGFSHLSQFTVDYKKVFGETPSTTRRRARGAAPDHVTPCRAVARGSRVSVQPTMQA